MTASDGRTGIAFRSAATAIATAVLGYFSGAVLFLGGMSTIDIIFRSSVRGALSTACVFLSEAVAFLAVTVLIARSGWTRLARWACPVGAFAAFPVFTAMSGKSLEWDEVIIGAVAALASALGVAIAERARGFTERGWVLRLAVLSCGVAALAILLVVRSFEAAQSADTNEAGQEHLNVGHIWAHKASIAPVSMLAVFLSFAAVVLIGCAVSRRGVQELRSPVILIGMLCSLPPLTLAKSAVFGVLLFFFR